MIINLLAATAATGLNVVRTGLSALTFFSPASMGHSVINGLDTVIHSSNILHHTTAAHSQNEQEAGPALSPVL